VLGLPVTTERIVRLGAVARDISPLGVTVNAISSGPVHTDITDGVLSYERKAERFDRKASDGSPRGPGQDNSS
jgi:enoyl-[acyl-carrier-protein] reductase (NADH)